MPNHQDAILQECDSFFYGYLSKVDFKLNLPDALAKGKKEMVTFFEQIPQELHNYTYAPNKWTVKEVFQHIIDTERVLFYRSLCMARGDKTNLPGFDENAYLEQVDTASKSMEQLLHEYKATREASYLFAKNTSPIELMNSGLCNGKKLSARAGLRIICGHEQWHIDTLNERYL